MNLLAKVLNFSAEQYLKTAGDLFIYHEDYESALDWVEKTLILEPNEVRALVLRGDILYCLNRDKDALESLNQALLINSHCVEALISKAGVLDVLGKCREALACCAEAFLVIKPFQAYLLPCLYEQNIVLLLRLKKYRQAMRLLSRAESCLSKAAAQELIEDYKHMIDRGCRNRQKRCAKNPRLPLVILNSALNQATPT